MLVRVENSAMVQSVYMPNTSKLISSGFKLQKMHFFLVKIPVWSSEEIVKMTTFKVSIGFNKVFNANRQGRKS